MARLSPLVCCLALVTAFLHGTAPGQDAKAIRPNVAQLVEQLGADSFQVRTAAWKQIEKLGIESLGELQEALKKSADPEVRRRLEEFLPNLERTAALTPTRLTTKIEDRPIREAIQEIARRTGYKLDLAAGNDREKQAVSADFVDATFWEVMDLISDRWGIAYQEGWYGNDNESLRLEFARLAPGYASTDGPFRVSIRRFIYNKQVDFTNRVRLPQQAPDAPVQHRKSETLSLELGVCVEPKLPLLSAGQPTLTEAVDDQGRNMLMANQNVRLGQSFYYGGYRSFWQQVQVGLQPTEGAKALKTLKGSVPVTLVSSTRPLIVVDKILDVKDKSFKEGSVTMKIEAVTKTAQGFQVRMTMSQASKDGQQDWNWINSLQQRLVLEDAKGVRFPCQGYNFDGNNFNGQEFVGNVTFGAAGQAAEPARLVYNEWLTMNHSVPFEFKDVPLP